MADLIIIKKSVGKNGVNFLEDMTVIGAALTAIGPERGGVFAPPLGASGLGEAIESFQRRQNLPVSDGRVDPGGKTLKRINEILNPGNSPFPTPPTPQGTGAIRPITPDSKMGTSVNRSVWAPIASSLRTEWIFKWTGVSGSGNVFYFELDEKTVPNWFGVLVPDGVTSFEKVHIFFHPTPAQAGYNDAHYQSKNGWSGVFHYMSDDFAVQFCAANTGQVLIMPLMSQGSAGNCGTFPERWESIVSQMLTQIALRPVTISSVVVSSFSSGITYSAAFRKKASLEGKLRGVIDFDGIISSYSHYSRALPLTASRMWQTGGSPKTILLSAAQNLFPLPESRWEGGPYKGLFKPNPVLKIHATIPQTMMFIAAGLNPG